MAQKFFTDTVESKFIKQLLKNTYLPLITSSTADTFIEEGHTYIFGTKVIYCTKSGIISPVEQYTCGEFAIINDNWILGQGYSLDKAQYTVVDRYSFGEFLPGLTGNFISNVNYYDPLTHKKLGEYLRAYKDYYGINLMPLYNCYCGQVENTFHYKNDGSLIGSPGENTKCYLVPIKYGRTYSVHLDSPTPITVGAIIYNDLGLAVDQSSGEYYSHILNDGEVAFHTQIYGQSSFRVPIKCEISFPKKNPEMLGFEPNLFLCIQVANSNRSSLTVIEGEINDPTGQAKCSLCQINTGITSAFSDKLIEYLVRSTITSNEDIPKNIERVKAQMVKKFSQPETLANILDVLGYPIEALPATSDLIQYDPRHKDVWSTNIKTILYYKFLLDPKVPNLHKMDTLGYVDADIENYLFGWRRMGSGK